MPLSACIITSMLTVNFVIRSPGYTCTEYVPYWPESLESKVERSPGATPGRSYGVDQFTSSGVIEGERWNVAEPTPLSFG